MILTVLGLLESPEWKKWAALALQMELIVTGLAGWCPIYWTCRVSYGKTSMETTQAD